MASQSMDSLFDRRVLVKKVHIPSRYLQRNIQASLMSQLKMKFEGKCLFEGFVQPNSITITTYSLGRVNMIKGGVDYDIEFQADICMPHAGQTLRATTTLRSKVGIHAEIAPLKILIPRDLHIGTTEFEEVQIGQDIEFEVVGAQFRQQDKDIIVVGRLKSALPAGALLPLLNVPQGAVPELRSSMGEQSEEKTVSIVKQVSEEKPRRKLKRKTDTTVNEPVAERVVEGAT
jgi:DNA-directed RNA polymerase subunit E'/Rpb7